MGTLHVMGKSGDTKITWEPDNEAEVAVAVRTFKDLTKEGYSAFRVKRSGERGEAIAEFDADAAEILFIVPIAGG